MVSSLFPCDSFLSICHNDKMFTKFKVQKDSRSQYNVSLPTVNVYFSDEFLTVSLTDKHVLLGCGQT